MSNTHCINGIIQHKKTLQPRTGINTIPKAHQRGKISSPHRRAPLSGMRPKCGNKISCLPQSQTPTTKTPKGKVKSGWPKTRHANRHLEIAQRHNSDSVDAIAQNSVPTNWRKSHKIVRIPQSTQMPLTQEDTKEPRLENNPPLLSFPLSKCRATGFPNPPFFSFIFTCRGFGQRAYGHACPVSRRHGLRFVSPPVIGQPACNVRLSIVRLSIVRLSIGQRPCCCPACPAVRTWLGQLLLWPAYAYAYGHAGPRLVTGLAMTRSTGIHSVNGSW